MTQIKDSGTRSNFNTGAVRDGQEGKGRMDLLPVRALIEVAKIFEAGAKKYAARNWEKGIPLSRYMDSGLRHAMKFLGGDRDEPHLAMACWNLAPSFPLSAGRSQAHPCAKYLPESRPGQAQS